jgi:hypothetical protein
MWHSWRAQLKQVCTAANNLDLTRSKAAPMMAFAGILGFILLPGSDVG